MAVLFRESLLCLLLCLYNTQINLYRNSLVDVRIAGKLSHSPSKQSIASREVFDVNVNYVMSATLFQIFSHLDY